MANEIKQLEKDKRKAISQSQWKEAAAACSYMGTELEKMGQYQEALECHLEELGFHDMTGDKLGQGVAHRRIGECYALMNNYKKAFEHIKSFLDIVVNLQNKIEEQRAWATLGRTYFLKYSSEIGANENKSRSRKTLDHAERAYLEALDLSEVVKAQLNNKEYAEMKARVLLNLGLVRELQGDIPQCAENIRQAIFLASKYDLYEDMHRCQTSLAGVYQKHGQYNFALRLMDKAIVSAEKLRNKTLLCDALCSKAYILMMLKDFEGGKSCLIKAYKLHSPIEEEHAKITQNLKVSVGLCQAQKKLQVCDPNDGIERKSLLEKIADGLSFLECYKLAIEFYLLTLKTMEENGDTNVQKAPIYFSLAATYHDDGNFDKALEFLKLELNSNESRPKEQIKTLWKMGEYFEEKQDVHEQEKILLQALSLAEDLKNEKLTSYSLTKLFQFYEKNKMSDKSEAVNSKLKHLVFPDDFSDESEVEEDTQDLFDDIHLSELSELEGSGTDNDINVTNRTKRQVKKLANKVNEKGETSLHQACINGNFTVVKRLVDSGHPVNVRDFCGWTPLHEACNFGFYDIVEYLLDNGASVNDRGGSKCGGVTPLHDAASCGHIDVMKLLISRGASVTTLNDNGETALHELVKWRHQMQMDLDRDTVLSCKKLEEELKSKMAQAGHPVRDVDIYSDSEDPNVAPIASTSYDNYQTKVTEKRGRSSSSSSTHSTDSEDVEYGARYNVDKKTDWDDAKEVKSEYEAVMSNLRRNTKSASVKLSPPKLTVQAPLINEQELVTDWLIKDTNLPYKTKRKRRRMSRLNIRTSKSICNYLTTKDESSMDSDEVDNVIVKDSNIVDDSSINHPLGNSETHMNAIKKTIITNQNNETKTSFCLKVRIADKVILVPVPNDSCTVIWLAEEATQRYHNLVGKRPHLTLTTKDEALLCGSDPVKNLFGNNEEVIANIDFWEEPSLVEYYEQLCNRKSTNILPSIKNHLLDCDTSGELNFSNCMLSNIQINVIFQSLASYKNLKYLNISGTLITDDNSCNIVSCLSSFPALISLDMSCCGLSIGTLRNMADIIRQQHGKANVLPNLKELLLNNNVFFSDCSSDLVVILQLPSLTRIDLGSCNLIPSCFENRDLCQVLHTCQEMEEFNISGNILNEKSISNLLGHLPKSNLKKLDLSHITKNVGVVGYHLSNYLSHGVPQLKEIRLENCYLTDNDLVLFKDSICYCPQLKSVSISVNPDLSADGICSFLQSLCTTDSAISEISFTGTCKWENTNISFLMTIINSSCFKRVSLDCIEKDLQERLIQSWKNSWTSKAMYHVCDYCELSTI